jgi:hypothetical protein
MAYTNIDDPSAYFQTALYAGNNTTDHNITNDGNSDLQPDFVWIKQRTSNNPHVLQDTSRGFAGNGEINLLVSNTTGAEATNGAFESFNTNGFGVGGTNVASGAYNLSGSNYVAWQWKANGGTTSSNTDGNTTTTVQANQDAGFSIVTYTGTGSSSQTMGHGLGVTPNIVLTKARSGTSNWSYNSNVGPMTYGTNRLLFQSFNALTADTNEVTAASSTTFTGGGSAGVNSNGATYIAYCFAEKQGYSKYGSYVGNGSTSDGVFVYLGFKPAFIITKKTSSTSSWRMYDNKRDGYNLTMRYLLVDQPDAEGTNSYGVDFLSNGFKMRNNFSESNYNGETYIYIAFAENPFTTSSGIPTTAR